MDDEDLQAQADHLTRLARAMLTVDPRLSRMYGERLREVAQDANGSVSARLVCDRCCMLQIGGVTASVTLAPVSGARAVQVLQGRQPGGGGNVVRVKCRACGTVGAVWGKPKRRRPRQEPKEEDKKKPKKKKRPAKLKSLSSQVNTAPSPMSFSLDDFLKL